MTQHIVIIGASHAGISCAEQLRNLGFSGAITLVDRQAGAPLERPPLSKSYLGRAPEEDEKFLLRRPEWYDKFQVTMIDGVAVDTTFLRSRNIYRNVWQIRKIRGHNSRF